MKKPRDVCNFFFRKISLLCAYLFEQHGVFVFRSLSITHKRFLTHIFYRALDPHRFEVLRQLTDGLLNLLNQRFAAAECPKSCTYITNKCAVYYGSRLSALCVQRSRGDPNSRAPSALIKCRYSATGVNHPAPKHISGHIAYFLAFCGSRCVTAWCQHCDFVTC